MSYAGGASLSAIGRAIYVLAVKRGSRTKFFYGARLKELRGHVRDGEEFVFGRYDRAGQWNAAYVGGTLATKRR